jgi:hypothetical protein
LGSPVFSEWKQLVSEWRLQWEWKWDIFREWRLPWEWEWEWDICREWKEKSSSRPSFSFSDAKWDAKSFIWR